MATPREVSTRWGRWLRDPRSRMVDYECGIRASRRRPEATQPTDGDRTGRVGTTTSSSRPAKFMRAGL